MKKISNDEHLDDTSETNSEINSETNSDDSHNGTAKGLKKCPFCGHNFKQTGHFNRHVQNKHTNRKCEHCDKSFDQTRLLTNHYKDEHPEHVFAFKCSECDQSFNYSSNCSTHMTKVHNIKKPKVTRQIPRVTSTVLIEEDGKTSRRRKPVHCDVCGISIQRMSQHILSKARLLTEVR